MKLRAHHELLVVVRCIVELFGSFQKLSDCLHYIAVNQIAKIYIVGVRKAIHMENPERTGDLRNSESYFY